MNQFKNLLAFLVLMGNDKVLDKSPDYIEEKFGRYVGALPPTRVTESIEWQWGLDGTNMAIFERYLQKWHLNDPESVDVSGVKL